ncbi:hypothetical protein A0H81_06741 [Grifola frondosa]|uniref:DNA replication regulator Sld3 C-terminal domain-containing protein n=1 Tax=Grifola frondosa TaxID=5627 RepID=A0A1C7M9U6_GRIFR|nr:hypothetical protein A0H81_06741 [Grifola frondosa]
MVSLSPPTYALSAQCPVKWTATQEKTISTDFAHLDLTDETPQDYVLRNYLQFLWLPQSIMPLQYFITSLRRIRFSTPPPSQPPNCAHPIHALLQSLLLTPRAAAQKYYARIPQVIADERETEDTEENMMWYALNHEKADEADDDERWRKAWLERMERREVQIQILLHMLPPSLSPSKKRKRRKREEEPRPPPPSIVERLESFMDRLSMWQLMQSIEDPASGAQKVDANSKGKARDDRDWMQVFCEDIVEPQFKAQLPEFCALLRSKVFRDSPLSEASDTLSLSPPSSPKQKGKRLKPAGAEMPRTSSRESTKRSLSLSLEQERARSRSLSVGPSNLRQRALVREVSMTTAFKGKTKARAIAPAGKTQGARAASKDEMKPPADREKRTDSHKGVTLVAATPVKPKVKTKTRHPPRPIPFCATGSSSQASRSQASSSAGGHYRLSGAADGDDEDEWTIPSSPDVLLLGPGTSDWDEDDATDGGSLGDGTGLGRGHILVEGTPTKEHYGVLGDRIRYSSTRNARVRPSRKAAPNLTNAQGNTLLMLAAYGGHTELVRGLLKRGADPNRINDRGQSPLAGAVFKGYNEVVQVLVDGGADPRLGTPTAIQIARMFKKNDMLGVLGAKAEDMEGDIPIVPGPPST